jgi:hypothetical protein
VDFFFNNCVGFLLTRITLSVSVKETQVPSL